MAMKFQVEQNGQVFLVVNKSTGDVKGRFKTKGEAEFKAQQVQKAYDAEMGHSTAQHTTPDQTSQTNDGTE